MPENKVSSFGLKVFFILSAHFTTASPLVRPDNQCISLTIWPNIPRWQRTVCCLLLSSARRNSSRWKAHYLFSIFFPFWNFYYSLQCYANFGCVAKWPSHTYADLPHIIFHHRLCQEAGCSSLGTSLRIHSKCHYSQFSKFYSLFTTQRKCDLLWDIL